MKGQAKVKTVVHDCVADDRNWIGRIENQLNCTKNWNSQWGFLAGGLKNIDPSMVTAKFSVDEKIKEIQKEIDSIPKEGMYKTSNMLYGTGQNVQMFKNNAYNILRSKDLRALERRLPKGWKKPKWTPPDDPFDQLKNLYKKKK